MRSRYSSGRSRCCSERSICISGRSKYSSPTTTPTPKRVIVPGLSRCRSGRSNAVLGEVEVVLVGVAFGEIDTVLAEVAAVLG